MGATEAQVLACMPAVRAMALKLAARLPRSVTEEDLVSAGHLGLAQAARRYDPARGPFGKFASAAVYGAMIEAVRELGLGNSHERSVAKGRRARVAVRHLSTIGSYGDRGYWEELQLADPKAPDPSAGAESAWDSYRPLRRRLTPRQRVVLYLYCVERLSFGELAQAIGVSLSRVSFIVTAAVDRLGTASTANPAKASRRGGRHSLPRTTQSPGPAALTEVALPG